MIKIDKGFCAYKHYTNGLLNYDIIPLIFPRKNFKIEKVLNSIQHTLDFFCDKTDRIKMKIRNLNNIVKSRGLVCSIRFNSNPRRLLQTRVHYLLQRISDERK